MIRRVASLLIVGGLSASAASAQSPTPPEPARPGVQAQSPPPAPSAAAPARVTGQPEARPSILRHNPLPRSTTYRSYYPYQAQGRTASTSSSTHGERGFANPGGVGRYSEYYDQNTPTSQVDQHPVPTARFDSGGGPDRAEQISAASVGQQRARNIQDNINAYGRPYGAFGAGFGYGLGLSGGLLYNYPN